MEAKYEAAERFLIKGINMSQNVTPREVISDQVQVVFPPLGGDNQADPERALGRDL